MAGGERLTTMFDEEDAVDEYDTHGYDYRSPDDEEVMPVNDFQRRRDKFDRDFERTSKMIYVMWIVTVVISLGLIGGGVFVVYKVLAFFGIL